jgi:hypothetical protein
MQARVSRNKAMSTLNKGEILRIKEVYAQANKNMIDYRMNLLSTLIEKKLGLTKRSTKSDNFINSFIYDVSKGI